MQLVAEAASFRYKGATDTLFQGVNGNWLPGSVNAVRGPSGSGKSTLLDLLGGLRRATSGSVVLVEDEGHVLSRERHREACSWVLQSNLVLSRRSVIDNVMISALIAGAAQADAEARALEALEMFGLGGASGRIVNSLSGGEQQRVTIARCLLASTAVILADEPTGNLDARNTQLVVECLRVAADSGKTVIVATHDQAVVDGCDSVLDLASA